MQKLQQPFLIAKIKYHVVQKQYETFNVQVKRMQGQKNKVAI